MTPEGFVKAQVAAFVYAEAAECGGHDSMLAIACVLRNRVRKGWFGGNWIAVLEHAGDTASQPITFPASYDLTSKTFIRVLQEIDDIFLGVYVDTFTDGGLYYWDSQKPAPPKPWFVEKILNDGPNHPRKAQVGTIYIFA